MPVVQDVTIPEIEPTPTTIQELVERRYWGNFSRMDFAQLFASIPPLKPEEVRLFIGPHLRLFHGLSDGVMFVDVVTKEVFSASIDKANRLIKLAIQARDDIVRILNFGHLSNDNLLVTGKIRLLPKEDIGLVPPLSTNDFASHGTEDTHIYTVPNEHTYRQDRVAAAATRRR